MIGGFCIQGPCIPGSNGTVHVRTAFGPRPFLRVLAWRVARARSASGPRPRSFPPTSVLVVVWASPPLPAHPAIPALPALPALHAFPALHVLPALCSSSSPCSSRPPYALVAGGPGPGGSCLTAGQCSQQKQPGPGTNRKRAWGHGREIG
eukprot:gene15034-biopygen615